MPVDDKAGQQHADASPVSASEHGKRSSKDGSGSGDVEKEAHNKDDLGIEYKGTYVDADKLGSRLEAAGVSDSYERKVYILNKILNEHIGFGMWHVKLLLVCGFGWFVRAGCLITTRVFTQGQRRSC